MVFHCKQLCGLMWLCWSLIMICAVLLQGKRAAVACMATTWFETYKRNVLKFINETGMEGLETDGQYEGYACEDESGDHHHNGAKTALFLHCFYTKMINVPTQARDKRRKS